MDIKTKVKFRAYDIEAYYVGEAKSPLDPSNTNHHNIKITNTDTKQTQSVEFWTAHGRIATEKELLFAFKSLIVSALMGALPAPAFCVRMTLDPGNPLAKPAMAHCRNLTGKIIPLLGNDTVQDIFNHLGKLGVRDKRRKP